MENLNKHVGPAFVAIVDDDLSVRRSTERLLRSKGISAEAFASAEDFLISGRLASTACLVLDLRMPGMDGLQLQRRLRELSSTVPIIFLTAHSSEVKERQALEAGAAQFLQKPVNKEVLLLAVHNALALSHKERNA